MAKSASRGKKTTSKAGGSGSARDGAKPAVADGAAADVDSSEVSELARLHIWQIQAFRDVLVVAAVVGIVWLGYVLRAVTVPLLVALLLAYLFEPLVSRLSRRPEMNRPTVVAGLLAIVVAAVLLSAAIVVPIVVGRTLKLVSDIQEGVIRDRLSVVEDYLPEAYREDYRRFVEILPGATLDGGEQLTVQPPVSIAAADLVVQAPLSEQRVREIVRQQLEEMDADTTVDGGGGGPDWMNIARGGTRTIGRLVGAVLGAGLVAFLVPFYFFFFSLWYHSVVRFLRNLIPERNRKRTLELLGKMDEVVSGFVRGRIIISLIMGVLLAIGWTLCGVPYAVPLGLVIGVFCAVPYLGAIGVPIAVGLLLLEGFGDPGNSTLWWLWAILWPSLVFGLVQLIEGWLLTPMIAGKVTGLDPVTILVAVLAGGSVLGVYGMLLAIPIAACLKILFTEVVLPRIHAWTRGEVPDPLPWGKGNGG